LIVCSRCGFENEDSDSFCGSCASFLEWDGKRVEADSDPERASEPEPEAPHETRQGLIDRVKEAIGFTDQAGGETVDEPAGAAAGSPSDPATETSSAETPDSTSGVNLGPVSAPLSRAGYPDVGQVTPPPSLVAGMLPTAGSGPSPTGTDIEAGGVPDDPGGVRVQGEPAGQLAPASADANETTAQPAPVVPGLSAPTAVRPGLVPPALASPLPREASPSPQIAPPQTAPPQTALPQTGAVNPGAVQPGAVQPGAVKPGASQVRRPVQNKPLATADVKAGDKICGQCGFGNDPTRRFCRHCGASLAEATVYTMSWYRRLWRRLTMRRQHAAGERPRTRRRAVGGSGPGWLTSWVTRVLTLAIAAVVVLSFVGPWHTSLHSRESRYYHDIANAIHPTYNPVHPVSATASSSAAGHPASNLIDGAINTSWQSDGTSTSQTITLQLPAPSDIAKIGFLNGDQDLPQDFVTEPRPQQLSIVFNGPKPMSKTITLSDTPNFQSFSISTKSTTSITISILSVYPATGNGKNVSIAEIELFTQS